MIEIWAFDMSGGPLGDRAQFLHRGSTPAALEALVPFTQGFRDGVRHAFSGFLDDCPREPVGFGVLDVKAHD